MPDSSHEARKRRRIRQQSAGVFDLSALAYTPSYLLAEVCPKKALSMLSEKQSLTYEKMLINIYDKVNKEMYGD